jgi:hypothetical protein
MCFMKPRSLPFMLVVPLATAVALAQEPPQPPPQEPKPAAESEKPATREVVGEVVAADAAAKTITVAVMVRKEAGAEPTRREATIPVDPEALAPLGALTAGDSVKLMCRKNPDGKVTAVQSIEKIDKPKSPSVR